MDSEDQSAYWFLKGEMQSRAPLNQMDLEQILEILQNVPAKEMNEAMEQAEMFGDEAAMIILVMADNKRKFREKYASEDYDPDEETTEETIARTTAYFAALKDKNPDLARKIEFSVKNYDNLPRKEIEDAGFDYQVIDEWVDYVGVEDENLVEFERCSDCEGEGIIITKYYPATRYDPADADFEKCEMCFGSGEIDPAEYMDKDGNYMAESWLTEGKCAICNSPSKFTVMTAIGERSFCCEACYADYVGLPVEEEGYYGLASESWQGKSLAGSLDEMLDRKKAEDWYGLKNTDRYSMDGWEGWTYEDNDGTVIYIDGPNGSIIKSDYETGRPTITLEEAKAYLNRKGIPYGEVYHSGQWDSVQFTHPKEECYKHDWSQNYYIEDARYEDDGTGGVVFGQRCNYVLCNAERRGHVGGKVHWDMAAEEEPPKKNAEETKSMNPYLLGAGIFALTLGLLSRKR